MELQNKLFATEQGMFNFLWKKKKKAFEPVIDVNVTLKNLQPSWTVDYDMTTWRVSTHHQCDMGTGKLTDKWELQSADRQIFLHYDQSGSGKFTISEKLPIASIEGNIKAYLQENDDAPVRLFYNSTTYYLDKEGEGLMFVNGEGSGLEFIYWDYLDDSRYHFVTLEQWGYNDYEARKGQVVEESQFANLTPPHQA
ncbi:MAG TPA: DUF4178 domain-containing protein [Thermodesulfovibrionia bacterium]|nr:DUF4178 domain-containing protein [Thermodesulfovibrionia bacterium]